MRFSHDGVTVKTCPFNTEFYCDTIPYNAPIMPTGITIRLSELRYLNGALVHWVKTVVAV